MGYQLPEPASLESGLQDRPRVLSIKASVTCAVSLISRLFFSLIFLLTWIELCLFSSIVTYSTARNELNCLIPLTPPPKRKKGKRRRNEETSMTLISYHSPCLIIFMGSEISTLYHARGTCSLEQRKHI